MRRAERRARRNMVFGAAVTVAVLGLFVTAGLLSSGGGEEQKASVTAAPTATSAPATTAAAGTTTGGAATTAAATTPQGALVEVAPAEIWEQPETGPACGPVTFEVTLPAPSGGAHVVRWQVADLFGETAMAATGGVARATVGPFPATTAFPAQSQTVSVTVVEVVAGTERLIQGSPVVLHDCP